jgi:hypothetical protein
VHARYLRKTTDFIDRQAQGAIDQSVNDQVVRRWIDCWNARVVSFEVKVRGRDRAGEALQRCQ